MAVYPAGYTKEERRMKATLEFTLPEEQAEFGTAVQAGAFKSCVDDFCQWLRSQRKHGDRLDPATLDEVWEQFHADLAGLLD